jgi:hypothetical protein
MQEAHFPIILLEQIACNELVTLTTITIETFRKALANSIALKMNWSEGDTKKVAEMVLSFFGFEDCIIDNLLKPKDRDVFYKLENEGLLKTFEEEVQIQKGKLWRIHYWMLNKPRIMGLAKSPDEVKKQSIGEFYDSMSDDIWHDHVSDEDE